MLQGYELMQLAGIVNVQLLHSATMACQRSQAHVVQQTA